MLGTWISRFHESVYGTTAGLPPGHHYGPTTLAADRHPSTTVLAVELDLYRGTGRT